jgi:hypothetical protein
MIIDMIITEKKRAGTPETSQEPRTEAAAPQRHTDWISYAVAVTQQPQTVSQNAR